ncbi:hypothetical protein OAL35_00780 [bacterium]|nr:hypothetical protein [bacterium]
MAKFYVQSGSFRRVIEAETNRNAAMWAVQKAIEQVVPFADTHGDSIESTEQSPETPYAVLSGKVTISDQGFDRDDACEMSTLDAMTEWNHLVTTLNRLEKMHHRAA